MLLRYPWAEEQQVSSHHRPTPGATRPSPLYPSCVPRCAHSVPRLAQNTPHAAYVVPQPHATTRRPSPTAVVAPHQRPSTQSPSRFVVCRPPVSTSPFPGPPRSTPDAAPQKCFSRLPPGASCARSPRSCGFSSRTPGRSSAPALRTGPATNLGSAPGDLLTRGRPNYPLIFPICTASIAFSDPLPTQLRAHHGYLRVSSWQGETLPRLAPGPDSTPPPDIHARRSPMSRPIDPVLKPQPGSNPSPGFHCLPRAARTHTALQGATRHHKTAQPPRSDDHHHRDRRSTAPTGASDTPAGPNKPNRPRNRRTPPTTHTRRSHPTLHPQFTISTSSTPVDTQ